MNPELVKNIVEAALFAANEPLGIDRLLSLFEENERPEKDVVITAIQQIQDDYSQRPLELREVANGFRFQVRTDVAAWVSRLWEEKPTKYSRALLETLALIAYRQPITRSEIEEIRGVAVSSQIVKTLQEREWIRVVGHRDVPGRPSLYATTRNFLDYFGLKSLEDLPPLADIKDISQIDLEAARNLDQTELDQIAQAIRDNEIAEALEPSAANEELVEEAPTSIVETAAVDELLPDMGTITDVVELEDYEVRDDRIDQDLVQLEVEEQNTEALIEHSEDEIEEELATETASET